MKNSIFVSGATGFQGMSIAKEIISKGGHVITLSNSTTESIEGITIIKGGFENEEALQVALKNVKSAIYTFPMIFDKELASTYTSNFIKAAEENGIEKVIFNASFDIPKKETGLIALDLKLVIKNLFDKSNLNVITLVPDVYIDNFAAPWSIPVMMEHGILPYPVKSNEKYPWISHTDLAKFTVQALEKENLNNITLPIGGNLFTGEEIAAEISNQIGKKINFVSMEPNDFEQQLIPAFGAVPAKEISNLYRYIEENKSNLTHKDFKKTQALLNVNTQSLKEWVSAVQWN